MRVRLQVSEPFELVSLSKGPIVLVGEASIDEFRDELTIAIDNGWSLGAFPCVLSLCVPRYVGDQVTSLTEGHKLTVHGSAEPASPDQNKVVIGSIRME